MSLDVYLKTYQPREVEVYSANITHNLGRMAQYAGIYVHLWYPEDLGIASAKELIEPLISALTLLNSEPERFIALNPTNGWGSYSGLVDFVRQYLNACQENPDALVTACR